MDIPPWAKTLSLHESIDMLSVDVIKLQLDQYYNKYEIDTLDLTGRTPLQCAIFKGLESVIKLLIEKDAKIDAKDVDGNTSLHYAVLGGNEKSLKILKMLIDKGVDINTTGSSDQTPLHVAVERDFEPCVKLLLDRGANINVQDNVGRTPLHYAVLKRNKSILELLIKQNAYSEVKDGSGQTALHLAAKTKYVKGVSLLLDTGSNVNTMDNLGNTPLHYSFFWKQKKPYDNKLIVDLLISNKANLELKNEKGQTPLHCAVIGNHFVEVLSLLEAGAEVNVKDVIDRTPLHYASMKKCIKTELLKTLLDHGAHVDSRDSSGQTPLHLAAMGCFLYRGALLVEYGADIDAKDNDLNSPLHLCLSQHSAFGKLLLEKGCDMNFKNNGKTPLQISVEENYQSLSKILINKGSDISIKYQSGKSLLHVAVSNMNLKIVKKLLQNNADVDCTDENGQTVLHYAAKYSSTSFDLARCERIINLLLLSGANILKKDNRGNTPYELAETDEYIRCGSRISQLLMEWNLVHLPAGSFLNFDDLPFNDNPDSLRWYFQVVNKTFVKLALVGLKENVSYLSSSQACQEFKKINTTKFGRHLASDVFCKYGDATILYNDSFRKAIFSTDLDKKFPLFANILRASFIKSRQRLAMVPIVSRYLNLPVPKELVWMILSYLSYDDFVNIVKAGELSIQDDDK